MEKGMGRHVSAKKGDNGCHSLKLHGDWQKAVVPLFFFRGKKDQMRIEKLSAIIIVRDGQIFRAEAIIKKLEMLMTGKQLPKIFLEQVLSDLEYLNYMAGALKKEVKK